MGREACAALSAEDGIELVGRLVRPGSAAPASGGAPLFDRVEALLDAERPDVLVDLTHHPASVQIATAAVEAGVSSVVGATGWLAEEERAFAERCERRAIGAALVPNFALGAALALRFAETAARYFPTAEIVELHHDGKRDKPSGTAKLGARRIAAVAGREVPIHSVRLRGLVAHEEILFGGEGEVLTIRHDSLSRTSFMPGLILAVRGVRSKRGLCVGLEPFLEDAS